MIDMFIVDIKDKTSRLVDEAARVGLEINARGGGYSHIWAI